MVNNCFDPAVVRVAPGTKVTWVNKEPIPHTMTGAGHRWGLTMGDLLEGDTYSQRFDEEGTFLYFCEFHPGMVGAVGVGDGLGKGTVPTSETKEKGAAKTATGSNGSEPATAGDKGGALHAGLLAALTAGLALLVGCYLLLHPRRRATQT
jgi:Copper binding proteins, plastocyanin/azurin family